MKRGDVAASALFCFQSILALLCARHQAAEVPGLGDQYFNIPISPLTEALSSIRTLGYPLFHAAMAEAGWKLEAYPLVQMFILLGCAAVFALGLRAYGLTGLTALAAASPLLWVVPVGLVMPETLAKCFAIAALGFLLWAAGSRRLFAYLGLAMSLFLAYQMRPAFLFLLVMLPLGWLFLYIRRWGIRDRGRAVRHGLYTALACALPLLLFCLLRLVVVGHFGLVSFAGQNTIGISVEMLRPETVQRLPMEDQPLAMLLARSRAGWPDAYFLESNHVNEDWRAVAVQYAANINRIGRAVQAKFPPPEGLNNVEQDQALSRMSRRTFQTHGAHYVAWLTGATLESGSLATELLLGGHGGEAFGLGPHLSIALALGLVALLLVSWPLERRAFGEGSRPFFAHAISVVLVLCALFFCLKMLLVILVEPPLPRYVQAALFLVPVCFAVLCWERMVILVAALCGKSYWYGQCLVAYPNIPDNVRPLPWRASLKRVIPGRKGAFGVILAALLLALSLWWTTRDNRFFRDLSERPESLRDALMKSDRQHGWRDGENATPLHYVALGDDVLLVNQMMADESLRRALTRDGASPLHWAAIAGKDASVVGALVGGGLSPNAPGPLGLSPVHLATLFGREAVLSALLDLGGNPDLKSTGYVAPLHLARSPAVANVLLDHGAPVDTPDGSRATPFMWAHTLELAAFFLEQGADINGKEDWRSFVRGCTPLHKAVYQQDVRRARWLLNHGADPNQGDLNNFTPLFYAIWRNNSDLVDLLLERGAAIQHPGRWLAFHRDDPGYRFTDIFGKTIGRHPKRDSFAHLVPDEATIRPLDWAAFLGNEPMIGTLIEQGAEPGRQNEYGMNALHWAVLAQQGKAAKWIRSLSTSPASLESDTLPLADFEADVARGHRSLDAPPEAPVPRAGLEAEAQRVVDEYNEGAPNVLVGEDGFLFTRQAALYLLNEDFRFEKPGDPSSGPAPALVSIVDINHQLADRGIHLIVVPAPMAIEVHTDAFYPAWDIKESALPERGDFIAALREGGVDALDLLPDFVAYRAGHPGESLYLEGDGHWNSAAVGIAADVLAKKIRGLGLDLGLDSSAYHTEVFEKEIGLPYLAKRLPEAEQSPFENTRWSIARILLEDGTPYVDDDASPVLVAGDSYTLVFNDVSGHLSARLAAELGRPVASYLGNAAGPIIPRILARKGKAYIDTRKVLLWVFSAAYIRPVGKDQWGALELP